MAIPQIITRGFGNGVFVGTIKGVALSGYEFGDDLSFWTDLPITGESWTDEGKQSNDWTDKTINTTNWS